MKTAFTFLASVALLSLPACGSKAQAQDPSAPAAATPDPNGPMAPPPVNPGATTKTH